MSNLILIPENLLALSTASAGGGTEASASMATANLLTEELSEFWRSTDNTPNSTVKYFSRASGTPITAKAFVLAHHNLHRGDQYRVVLSSTARLPGAHTEALVPTGTAASTTATSPSAPNYHLDADEGFTTDGSWISSSATENWGVRFTFNTPATTPQTGASRQAFWLYVKSDSVITTGAIAPTVKVELYDNAALKADLGTKTIQSATGQWLCFPWNASDLTTASGVNAEIKITFSGRDDEITASATPKGLLGSVVWMNEKPDRFVPVTDGDSGWLTYDPTVASLVTFNPEAEEFNRYAIVRFGTSLTFREAHLLMRSDHAPTDYDYLTEELPIPPGYVQAGGALMGETWSPACDRDFGGLVVAKDYSSKSRTYGGQRFGAKRFVQRILPLPLNWLTPAEAQSLFDRIVWRQGILKPFFLSILPGDATEEKHTSFLATLRNPENGIAATTTRGKSRAMTLEFEEEL